MLLLRQLLLLLLPMLFAVPLVLLLGPLPEILLLPLFPRQQAAPVLLAVPFLSFPSQVLSWPLPLMLLLLLLPGMFTVVLLHV